MAKKSESLELQIVRVDRGQVSFCILGTTPIILNRMSEKAMHELLMPRKKTAADKAQNLKHDPMAEFLASPYLDLSDDGPTYIQHLSSAFGAALRNAALDVPGSSKAQIGRLAWVEGERVSIYGVPQMLMSVTRSADMNKTPDVRTRCIVPRWAAYITVSFVIPQLNATAITNLLCSAGMSQGIGDWRREKGKGNYGSFELVSQDHPEFAKIIATGGRAVQIDAMAKPESYDRETQELFSWFQEELQRRGREVAVGNGKAARRTKATLPIPASEE
ncbi:MAG: hypothetical protein A3E01_02655 [Gammaproteobacteria bacterium RIFCSPHIGHO2_12_FULL_63_22]|nr:MAG: hypothetical protein A3E01_02655 [Gammaproteobacteria bacterium RIFCSPHIGHO2_12_FULL_63_22]